MKTIKQREASSKEVVLLDKDEAERVMREAFEAAMRKGLAEFDALYQLFKHTADQADQNWPLPMPYVPIPRKLARQIGKTLGVKTAASVLAIHRQYMREVNNGGR